MIFLPLYPALIALSASLYRLRGTWFRSRRLCVVIKLQDVSLHGCGPTSPLAQRDKFNLGLLSDKDHRAHPACGAQQAVSKVKQCLDALNCGGSIH